MSSRSVSTFLVLLVYGSPTLASFHEEKLTARAAFLMDATTGQVLYQREPDLPLPPASTTKIMTAIVALESDRKEKDLLRVSKNATRVPSSKLYLRPGQSMTIEHLLYSVLLSSANDSSLVLAEGIAGSVQQFTEKMTQKAREIGATHTQFTNPHGLTARGHYSTARDMALIFNYAMENPRFREIVQTKTASVSSFSGDKRRRVRRMYIRNHNRLLWNFEGAIGGKTGYTYAAQRCFVGGVSRDGVTLILSIMGSRNLWRDITSLLEYGLQQSETLKLASSRSASPPSFEPPPAQQERDGSPHPAGEGDNALRSVNGYILQVASFQEQERAEFIKQWLAEGGFEAYMETAPLNDGHTTYRVRVGPYDGLGQAQEVAREIEEKGNFKVIIIPAIPGVNSAEKPDETADTISQ